ncbi:uncharacterized protein [Asterias amurensis]|uniref:uncharacterized protein n=1 Tax=Asterias amurensis TaxID=7602 RepID=UPI003AB22E03
MAVFRSIVVFVTLCTSVTCCPKQPDQPEDTCCQQWSSGSRMEPALYSTMGTGPSSHASSVVCFFYKNSACVVCTTGNNEVKSCCTDSAPKNGDIPENEYLILYNANKGVYDLAPLSANGNSYLKPDQPDANGQSGWTISRWDSSYKGVDVDNNKCWENLKALIDKGIMQYHTLQPKGFLYVVDE